jgi:hypothetical protein
LELGGKMECCGGNEQGLLSCACRGGVVGMVRGGGGCRAREMAVVAGSAWGMQGPEPGGPTTITFPSF